MSEYTKFEEEARQLLDDLEVLRGKIATFDGAAKALGESREQLSGVASDLKACTAELIRIGEKLAQLEEAKVVAMLDDVRGAVRQVREDVLQSLQQGQEELSAQHKDLIQANGDRISEEVSAEGDRIVAVTERVLSQLDELSERFQQNADANRKSQEEARSQATKNQTETVQRFVALEEQNRQVVAMLKSIKNTLIVHIILSLLGFGAVIALVLRGS